MCIKNVCIYICVCVCVCVCYSTKIKTSVHSKRGHCVNNLYVFILFELQKINATLHSVFEKSITPLCRQREKIHFTKKERKTNKQKLYKSTLPWHRWYFVAKYFPYTMVLNDKHIYVPWYLHGITNTLE